MKKSLIVCLVVALAGLAACERGIHFRNLGPQETVLIQLRTDSADGLCKINQRTPPELRARPGSTVRWMFVGGCDGNPTIGIRPMLMLDGKPVEGFDPAHPETRLEDTVPSTPGPPLELRARVRTDLAQGHYKYQILMNGKPVHFNSEADEGSFFVCPGWPCDGGFKAY